MNRAKSTRRVRLLSRMGSPTCRLHTGKPWLSPSSRWCNAAPKCCWREDVERRRRTTRSSEHGSGGSVYGLADGFRLVSSRWGRSQRGETGGEPEPGKPRGSDAVCEFRDGLAAAALAPARRAELGVKRPVPERRSCRTSGTHGARRIHRLSPRRPVRGVLSRRASLLSVGRTPKPRPKYPPRSRTCSPSSLVATAPNRGDRSAVEARGSSSTSKTTRRLGRTTRSVTRSTQPSRPCKSHPVRLGSYVSRDRGAPREIACFRPGPWPQGQLRHHSKPSVPANPTVPRDRG
jgi:hypothetical protein